MTSLGGSGHHARDMDDITANGSGSQGGDDAGQRGVRLPCARAFVVQFTSETDARLEHAEGRVEHMQSGRRVRFASAVDLLACIVRLLADDQSEQTRREVPTTGKSDHRDQRGRRSGETDMRVKRMRDRASLHLLAGGLAIVALLMGCGQTYQRVENSLSQPINCATARQEIQTLQSQKVSKSEEAAAGLSYALPTTIFIGAITGTGGAKYEVGTGEFNRKIDDRIADIRSTCRLD